jgi:hypothetical protein
MPLELRMTAAFERNPQQIKKRRKDLDKPEAVNLPQEQRPLPLRCRRVGEAGLDIGTAVSNRIGCFFTR